MTPAERLATLDCRGCRLALRNCDHRFCCWLRTLLAAGLLALPTASTVAAPPAPAGGQLAATRAAAGTRFSDLAELTPANVRGLLALVAGAAGAILQQQERPSGQQPPGHELRVDRSADVNPSLQRFVGERLQSELAMQDRMHLEPPGGSSLIRVLSYVRGTTELRAWDPLQQRIFWSVRDALPGSSRALVTAGGLVFYGTSDGWLKALDAHSGRVLWKHRVEGRQLDEPSSYLGPDGHQYLAVRSLPRGPDDGPETSLVFALPH